jgi:hypothetical protein
MGFNVISEFQAEDWYQLSVLDMISNDKNIISNILVTSVVFDDFLWYGIQDIPK